MLFFFSSLKLLTTNAEIMKHLRTWNVVSVRGRRWDGGMWRGGNEGEMGEAEHNHCRIGVFPDQRATINPPPPLPPLLSALCWNPFISASHKPLFSVILFPLHQGRGQGRSQHLLSVWSLKRQEHLNWQPCWILSPSQNKYLAFLVKLKFRIIRKD